MRKMLFGLMSATMLFAASCSNDVATLGDAGNEALVSLKVSTPEIVSRAYSDGTTATQLQYAVYDANGDLLPALNGNKTISISTNIDLTLTTGNTYTVVCWAAATDAPYTVDFAGELANAKMTVDYNAAKSNDENRDAFYGVQTFEVNKKSVEVSVLLKRPFAQLNIGTADYAASKDAGYTPTLSYVKVPVSKTLTFANGEVDDSEDVIFNYAEIPTGEDFPITGYEYLAMNYLLVPASKELVEVEFGYKEEGGVTAEAEKTRTIGSVPVQRNYRTNIFGNILTSDVDIKVEIKPEYEEPDYNVYREAVVKTAQELENALLSGSETITLADDIVLGTEGVLTTKNTLIDLNGFSIKAERNYVKGKSIEDISVFAVSEGAKVQFVGDGSIINTAAGGAYGIAVSGNAEVEISGNIKVSAFYDALYVGEGRLLVSNGFYSCEDDTTPELEYRQDYKGEWGYCHPSKVVNCHDGNYNALKAIVTLTGGTYVNMDPSNIHEGTKHNQNIVADGYTVIREDQANGDAWFIVVKDE